MTQPLVACLPPELQAGATITKITAGLSGAGVYRVEANGHAYVLKIAGADEPLAMWQRSCEVQTAAGRAGIAPLVVHSDAERRAIVSAFVIDRSFPARYGTPATREVALREIAEVLRRVHALAIPSGAELREPRDVLTRLWPELATFAMPTFARDAVERALAEAPPPRDRALVLSHNDVNPSNLVWDGENLLLLDWDMSGPNDPFYDLAAISVFLRMDDDTCARLIAMYDDAPVAALPARFLYNRRFMSAFIGAVFLRLARAAGHVGAHDSPPITLLEVYQAMREGKLNPGAADGQWSLGMAMLRTSASL